MQDIGFFSFLLCMVGFEVQMRLIAGGTQLQRTRILSGDSRSDKLNVIAALCSAVGRLL